MDYFAQITKDRIKELAKKRKATIFDITSSCSLGINAVSQIDDKKGMSSYSLARIADYLDCSVDYLLGRTDEPAVNRGPAGHIDNEDKKT